MQLPMQGFPPKANQDIYSIVFLNILLLNALTTIIFLFERQSDYIVCVCQLKNYMNKHKHLDLE